MKIVRHSLSAALLLFTCAFPSVVAAQQIITACGTTVTSKTAVLANDLNCSAASGVAIEFQGKELDLAGHSVQGHSRSIFSPHVIHCTGACTISNGTVIGGNYGIYGEKKLTLENVAMQANEVGAVALSKVQMEGGSITNSGAGISTKTARLSSVAISGCDKEGVYAYKTARIESSNITGNDDAGIYVGRAKIESSTIAGNCVNPYYDQYCSDLQACNSAPKVTDSTCDTSNVRCYTFENPPIQTWGVCALD